MQVTDETRAMLIRLGFKEKGIYWERSRNGVLLRYQNGVFYNYSSGQIGQIVRL